MEAVILAGGFGTRLQPVVKDVPKPMALINDKPFLEYLLEKLFDQKFERIVLAVGYKKEKIMTYFGNKYKDIELLYSIEEDPLLTGGAIKKALNFCKKDNIFVINGDTYFEINYTKLLAEHLRKNADVTVAVKQAYNFDRYGTIKLDDCNRIVEFYEKKYAQKALINGGIYIIQRKILDKIQKEKFSFENDYIKKYYKFDNIFGALTDGFFIDIGIPEDYELAQKLL